MFSMLQSKIIFRAILGFCFSFIKSNISPLPFLILKKCFIAVTRQPLNLFMLFLYADRTWNIGFSKR